MLVSVTLVCADVMARSQFAVASAEPGDGIGNLHFTARKRFTRSVGLSAAERRQGCPCTSSAASKSLPAPGGDSSTDLAAGRFQTGRSVRAPSRASAGLRAALKWSRWNRWGGRSTAAPTAKLRAHRFAAFVAVGAFGVSHGAFGAFGAFIAFGAFSAFGAFGAFGAFDAFGAFGAVDAFGVVGTVGAVGAIGAVGAVGAVGSTNALGAIGAVDAVNEPLSLHLSLRNGAFFV